MQRRFRGQGGGMRVGIDFDNTIAIYDHLFHSYAVDRFHMPPEVPPDKASTRKYFWEQPSGKNKWIELQGIIYGEKIQEARIAPGLDSFLKSCSHRKIPVFIISHKTEYPARGPKVHLHEVAWKWLENNGFFDPKGFGLKRENVFFENERSGKLGRIEKTGCSVFVDDLPEIFEDSNFPSTALKLLYDPQNHYFDYKKGIQCLSWHEIQQIVSRNIIEEMSPDLLKHSLGCQVSGFEFLNGGSNNLIAKMDTPNGAVVLKFYYRDPRDLRDRLNTEFHILRFLWDSGLRCIPEPLAIDTIYNFAIYRFQEGHKPVSENLTLEDIYSLSDLLQKMWTIRDSARKMDYPNASEACLSYQDYVTCIESRLQNLNHLSKKDECEKAALDFLTDEFMPVFTKVKKSLKRLRGYENAIQEEMRTLSPSDHGFHNAIKTTSGQWVFFDFEYAGWDDPAKMIADACFQPAVPITDKYRKPFIESVLEKLDTSRCLASRLEAIYPAVGLKWCMIFLNDFHSASRARKRFVASETEWANKRWVQLEKARRQLEELKDFT